MKRKRQGTSAPLAITAELRALQESILLQKKKRSRLQMQLQKQKKDFEGYVFQNRRLRQKIDDLGGTDCKTRWQKQEPSEFVQSLMSYTRSGRGY